MATQTDPLAGGIATSEGKGVAALFVVGLALEAFSAALQSALEAHPNTQWLSIAALVTGAAVQLFSILGYTKNRTAFKSNVVVQALASGVPIVISAVSQAVLKNVQDKPLPAVPPAVLPPVPPQPTPPTP